MGEMKVVRIDRPGKREIEVMVGEGEEKELKVVVDGRLKSQKPKVKSQNYNSKFKNLFEIKIRVIHVGQGGKARVELRGVVSGGAKLKAEGLIKIEKGAQEVESFLDMRGLMLDKDSMMEIDPQLEIEANEVRASHAASVGQVDEVMLEFLGSMGIKREVGKKMVVEGFLGR